MGFIGDAVGGLVGSVAGGITSGSGAQNKYQATAPMSGFSAQAPAVSQPLNTYQATPSYSQFAAQGTNVSAQPGQNYTPTLDQALAQAGGGAGPAANTIGQQQNLANLLYAQSRGEGPSVAQQQLQNNTQAQIANISGAINGARGMNPATAARIAAQQGGSMLQQSAGQAALLRNQEILDARNQLNGTLTNMGGMQLGQQAQGTGLAGTLGGLQNQQNALDLQGQMANQQSNLGVQSLNAQTAAQNAGLGATYAGINQQTAAQNAALGMQAQQLSSQNQLGAQQLNQLTEAQNAGFNLDAQRINAGVSGQNAQTAGSVAGGLLGAGGAAAAALSDERVKTGIQHEGHDFQPGLAPGVPAATFEYKGDPSHQRYEGVLAQELARQRPDLVAQGGDGLLRVDPTFAPKPLMAEGGNVPALLPTGATSGTDRPKDMASYLSFIPVGGTPAMRTAMPDQGPVQSVGALMAQPGVADRMLSLFSHGTPASSAPPSMSTAMPQIGSVLGSALGSAGSMMSGPPTPGALPPGDAYARHDRPGYADGGQVNALYLFDPKIPQFGGGADFTTGMTAMGAGLGKYLANRGPSRFEDQTQLVTGTTGQGAAPNPYRTSYASGGIAELIARGGRVPGKAPVAGDSPRNDTVDAKLSPGEVVLPRSVALAPDAPVRAKKFVEQLKRNAKVRSVTGEA